MAEIKTTRSFFFPTQVWTFGNPDIELNNQLRDRILELEKSDTGVIKSNQGGWQSRDGASSFIVNQRANSLCGWE